MIIGSLVRQRRSRVRWHYVSSHCLVMALAFSETETGEEGRLSTASAGVRQCANLLRSSRRRMDGPGYRCR